MKSFAMPAARCTNCGYVCDAAMNVGGDQAPRPGDFTVCVGCGHVMAFAGDFSLRNLRDEEMITVAGDRRLLAAQRTLAKLNKGKRQ